MNVIVAVDKNWAIGRKGELLVRIPEDQKLFRRMTTGNVIILGRKTIDTFPGGMPLKNRTNIILSANPDYKVKGGVVVHSIGELLEECKKYPEESLFVIGGDSVYRQLLPYCNKAYVTYIDFSYQADAYFPNLDKDPEWELTGETEEETYFNLEYYFRIYERVKG